MSDLKPCPFCGSEKILISRIKHGFEIKCGNCNVKFVQKVFRYSLEWLKEKMINNWNTRVNCSSLAE